MTINGFFQITLYSLIIVFLIKPVGLYMAKVFNKESTFLDPLLCPFENLIYRFCRVDQKEQNWVQYTQAMLLFNLIGIIVLYLILRLQNLLPFNPGKFAAVSPDLAFNIAVSFVSNTNWQSYAGENTISYFTEMIGLTANGIKNRIKDLEQGDIIQKYSLALDFKKFGYEWYGLQLKLTKFDVETITAIQKFFKNHLSVIFYYKYIGPWDYDVGFIAKNSTALRDFINELRTTFPEELKIVDVFITLEEIKGYQLPEGIFRWAEK